MVMEVRELKPPSTRTSSLPSLVAVELLLVVLEELAERGRHSIMMGVLEVPPLKIVAGMVVEELVAR